ncbi:3-dehydroquinate synthase [Leptospira paudalimensis]|uniref:3-dehydroquinate synthase n=1 Tax=Leptospira paudalimensis TaxID=2950024 RepID=A0ABT3M4I9_9LEPT|nr:3-dehydroquinate synthase [Leptospira paudalimensis]MCW7503313.1 3-dehydroquinate synthase [Leptospira paudalimensis]
MSNRFNSIQSEFQVSYRYEVFFAKHLFALGNSVISNFFDFQEQEGTKKKVLVVVDNGILEHQNHLLDSIHSYFETNVTSVQLVKNILTIPGGENAKNQNEFWELVSSAISEYGIDRHSYVMAIGGGAFLDMVGFATAVSHRGIRLIRIPTTVLSQNDSGVGVKNSINYLGKKNFLGTFAPPIAVFNDSSFLVSLDERDWRSGIAEAVKVSLIKEETFFRWIESNVQSLVNRDIGVMEQLVFDCARLHIEHIRSGDPFEFGSSRPLDFGHWFAHKLEYLSNFSIRHGEAVAVGIALDSIYSFLSGDLEEKEYLRILRLLLGLGFTLNFPILLEKGKENLEIALEEFREHLGGKLTLLMLDGIGKPKEVYSMDQSILMSAFDIMVNFR